MSAARAVGLAGGWALDCVLGDPSRLHPVAGFGTVTSRLEDRLYADSRAAGVAWTTLLVGSVAAVGAVLETQARTPTSRALATAAATWVVLGGAGLATEGQVMTDLLRGDDVPGARRRLSHLCSRDAAELSPAQLARASVESLAENTSDAVTAPLFWGAVAGLPGLLGYRAANTLDAMAGYRSARYRRFGWSAARLDDVLNLVPARIAAALAVALAPAVGGDPRAALRAWRRDAPAHPSPNAGPVEAAFAGALGVRLGGENSYGGDVEDRGRLGDGHDVLVADLPRAVRLSRVVAAASAGLAAVVALTSTPTTRTET